MYIIYEQKQKSYFIIASMSIISLALLILYFIFFFHNSNISSAIKNSYLAFLIFCLLLFKSFYQLVFRVTSDGLEYGYWLFKNKVSKDNIKSVFIDNSKGNFFGYGIRFGRKKTIGFISKFGSGLRIILKDQRQFFVSLDNPEEALNVIKQNNYV